MNVGETLCHARKEKGLTQEQLSQETGLSRSYICDIETGRCAPSLKTLQKLSAALALQVSFLPEMTEIQDKT